MKYYQEITLIADDIPFFELWSKVYTQLHIALADVKNQHGVDGIGVSFPNYKYEEKDGKTFATLGSKLRIFANTIDELDKLALPVWLARLIDYVHLTTVKEVGDRATGNVIVRRYRYKDFDKKVAEFAQFKGISEEKALAHCRTHKRPIKRYPFITLKSETNQSDYRLSIWQETANEAKTGSFNTYGINNMSNDVTVPNW
ncbi:type I-F CRISPR-associated endoribonuclease Cas6/Csy4 [Faucicola atlantae]|uniref:Type I-F CRISPR-associated endoribonuclease Cas6/Csy4 n=1 Tax=Faucicola atlantae TaxID=34059 RepID=A0A1B8QD72_9GAMM|nr:type I-F CRISPR-associated endoribonuclease Cas6/Csy4 [Moraxella atlantae]OBX79547.1 type I-F CRISPR-associated endoribonuclease Cas6/Csy4 [Moraxella atlantae]